MEENNRVMCGHGAIGGVATAGMCRRMIPEGEQCPDHPQPDWGRKANISDTFAVDRLIGKIRDLVRDEDPRAAALALGAALWRTLFLPVDFDLTAGAQLMEITLMTGMEYEQADRDECEAAGRLL